MKNWEECPAPGKKRKAPKPLLDVWETKSVFWDLAYWPILDTPHCLDVMHITKNVCESLLGTLFNMPDRTKDGPKSRHDLMMLNIRGDLHLLPSRGKQPEEDGEETDDRKRKRAK